MMTLTLREFTLVMDALESKARLVRAIGDTARGDTARQAQNQTAEIEALQAKLRKDAELE